MQFSTKYNNPKPYSVTLQNKEEKKARAPEPKQFITAGLADELHKLQNRDLLVDKMGRVDTSSGSARLGKFCKN